MSDTPASNAAQRASPTYRLAALDEDFLLGDSMRGVRFLLEFAKADEALRLWGIGSTLVVFGSARVREDGPGEQPRWYAAARAFARLASERGGALLAGVMTHAGSSYALHTTGALEAMAEQERAGCVGAASRLRRTWRPRRRS